MNVYHIFMDAQTVSGWRPGMESAFALGMGWSNPIKSAIPFIFYSFSD